MTGKTDIRELENSKIPFTAEHAENAETNPERKSFLCGLCALCGEHSLKRYHEKF